MRKKTKNTDFKRSAFSEKNIIVFAIFFALIGGYAIYRSFAASPNIYVSTTGNDSTCVRGDSTKPCQTFQQAYQIAQPGDNIQVADGNYVSQSITRGSQSQSGPMITFTGGSGVVINGNLNLGANNGSPSGDTPNYLTFDGINIKNGLLSTYYEGSSAASEPQPNHLVIENAHIQCTAGCSGHLISLNSMDNVTVRNVELGPQCCDGDAVELSIPRDGAPDPSNITLDKLYIHDLYDTCNNMPAALKSQVGCSGVGFGDGCAGCDHVDGIQGFGGHNITISNSRVYSVNPSSSNSTGAAQGIFLQPVRGTYSNLTFVNNMITCGCGTNTFSLSGPGDSSFSGYIKFLYNSVDGNGIKIYDQVLAPGTQVIYAGNISKGGFIQNSTSNSCSFVAGDGSTVTPIFKNNLWPSQSCDPSDKSGTPSWVSENFYSPDLHLSTSSQAAVDGGESIYCPATDIDGQIRPAGSACDIGADEFGSTGGGTPAPTVSLFANPTSVNSGSSSTLTWSSTDATTCVASGGWSGSKATSGSSSTGNLSSSSSYTLSCSGAGGTTQASTTVTVNVAGAFTIGETTILPNADDTNANLLLAQSATLAQTATIQSLSFYVTNAAGKLRLGIYDSSGPSGGPGSLKAQTAEITPTTGWNTANVTSQLSLAPGTYWLAYLPSDNNLAFTKTSDASSSGRYYSYAYAALPNTYSPSPSSTSSHWSLYATLNTGTSSSVPGDTNNDGHVTITDLSTVLSHFGQSGQSLAAGDTNGDGSVTIADLSTVLSHFGQ